MSNDTRSSPMTAEVELLPLPSSLDYWFAHKMTEYARANVAHATAALQAEAGALRAEVDALREALASLKAENERLREALKDADNELDWIDEEIDSFDYWNMRRKMKAALSKENKA